MKMLSSEFIGVFTFSLIIRWLVSLNLYSGSQKPPMFGDFEAQRHWMEITFNLHPKQWYVNGTENDLMYWGLDYPPITAYHSWLCGYIANTINSSWVQLHSSRGLEDPEHKLFMRLTVLVADLLVFIPAVFVYFNNCTNGSPKHKLSLSLLVLLYPGLLLIDHGHFQYNSVSLGLCVWGVVFLARQQDCLGAIAFVLALNYKQMELYHALPYFCYLLGNSFRGHEYWLWKLTKIGTVVMVTFALCWLLFLDDLSSAAQVLHRLFPFARGLYEDKVANVWCSLSVFVKLKELDQQTLIRLCLGATCLCLLPSCSHVLMRPTIKNFKLALVNSSLAFFLFSFQVHEKSILIPAISVCLLMPDYPFESFWFLIISTFSMLPLLIKDLLLMPYFSLMVIFFVSTITLLESAHVDASQTPKGLKIARRSNNATEFWPGATAITLFSFSLFGVMNLTVLMLGVSPPSTLPDIFPVLIAMFSCAHFSGFFLYFNYVQYVL